jgi:ubiquinone/menaquinone biosynthesis C-methylase UbiE
MPTPAFASDPATAHYYDRRAAEYDEWYTGQGSFAGRERPGWTAEVDQLVNLVRQLPPARTLDVACGTGFLTRHLRGFVVGLDQSPSRVAIAQSRLPDGLAVVGDALHLMVADHAFDRVMTGGAGGGAGRSGSAGRPAHRSLTSGSSGPDTWG